MKIELIAGALILAIMAGAVGYGLAQRPNEPTREDAIREMCKEVLFPRTQHAGDSWWDKSRPAGETALAIEGCVSMTLNKR